ncbi:MarR family winged helix-turn-helix transcriptional regulator [Lacticaseibacillus zhaodongensis]|uniref:MarR family winged helix-turn-helix transcriptional regulator n=1 Tax=Lacticaseibacillus zhaodongensis TaxID=2668065 RepID=UPI0012D3171B|nr:MarR family transcriptional regulator [Lacticaseibacillus zhaodongensis]
MIDQNDNTITKQLNVAAHIASQVLEHRLKPLGVNRSQFFFILKLHDDPGVTQDQLVREDSLHQSNVNREIARLAELGFVDKQQSDQDRRKYVLRLTPAGEELYPKIKAALDAQEDALAQRLAAAGTISRAELLAALRQIALMDEQ